MDGKISVFNNAIVIDFQHTIINNIWTTSHFYGPWCLAAEKVKQWTMEATL